MFICSNCIWIDVGKCSFQLNIINCIIEQMNSNFVEWTIYIDKISDNQINKWQLKKNDNFRFGIGFARSYLLIQWNISILIDYIVYDFFLSLHSIPIVLSTWPFFLIIWLNREFIRCTVRSSSRLSSFHLSKIHLTACFDKIDLHNY